MTLPSQTTDVVTAVRNVIEVNRKTKTLRWDHVPYDLVVSILRHEFGYGSDAAHEAIFQAVMEGQVRLAIEKVQRIDSKKKLCLETEDSESA